MLLCHDNVILVGQENKCDVCCKGQQQRGLITCGPSFNTTSGNCLTIIRKSKLCSLELLSRQHDVLEAGRGCTASRGQKIPRKPMSQSSRSSSPLVADESSRLFCSLPASQVIEEKVLPSYTSNPMAGKRSKVGRRSKQQARGQNVSSKMMEKTAPTPPPLAPLILQKSRKLWEPTFAASAPRQL